MSGEVIKEFLVGLGFDIDEGGLAKFSSSLSSAAITVTALGAAVTAAAGAVFAGVQKIAGEYDQLDKLATQFRATADAVDEFIDASQILGISNETALQSLKDFDRAIIDTSMNMGRAKKVFEELGITVKDAAGNLKPTTQVMAELQDKMQGMERGKQLRIMERLGIDPSLIKLFNADMAALRAEMEAIDKAADFDFETAIVESKAFTKTWKELQQEIQKWKMLIGKAIESIAVKLMPGLRKSMGLVIERMQAFRKTVMEAMPGIIAKITPIIELIIRIAQAFVIIVGRVAQAAAAIINWLVRLNDATDGWAGYILAAAAAWKYLNLAFLKTPLGMLIALATVIALLIDDFLTFREGGESLIDWSSTWGQVLMWLTGIVSGITAAIVASKLAMAAWAAGVALFNGIAAAWAAVMGIVNGVMAAARIAVMAFNLVLYANPIGLVIAAIAALVAAVIGLIVYWDQVKAAFSAGADAILSAWEGVKSWFTGFFDWIMGKFAKMAEWGGKIADFFGMGGEKNAQAVSGGSGAMPALAPSPQAAAAVTGGNQNVNQQTQIVVQGSTDPQTTARAVAGQQDRVNADMARNMKGAAR